MTNEFRRMLNGNKPVVTGGEVTRRTSSKVKVNTNHVHPLYVASLKNPVISANGKNGTK